MKERLVIKNFGPIKSVDIELGKMTILIGEQATGKSTIAKVLAVCRYFSFITDSTNNLIRHNNIYADIVFKEYGILEYINDKSFFYYDCNDYTLEVSIVNDGENITNLDKKILEPILKFQPKISEEKSEKFKVLMEEFKKIKPHTPSFGNILTQHLYANWNIPSTFLLNEVKGVMDNPFYFPTERGLQSVFSLGRDSVQNLSDLLYNQFVKLNDIYKNYKNEVEIKPLNLLYIYKNNQGYIRKHNNDSDFHSLRNGASGYQSTVPIVLAIKYYTEIERRKRYFIVEEPELSLFPRIQKNIVEFFVESINSNGHSFLLPTHSPYILSALDSLMYAHKVAHLANGKYKDEVNNIIPEKYWIDQKDVSAYFLNEGGAIEIVEREAALINKNFIDSVSEVINKQFDKLLEIEVKHENPEL